MGISSISSGSGGSWGLQAMQHRQKPPDMTKDQLTEMQSKLKSEGKDTSNLDKIVSNFDQLDRNQDGKVGMDELKSGAEALGIELPEPKGGGKPPALSKDQLSQITEQFKADGKDTTNLETLISNFDELDTDQDGTVSLDELQAGAKDLGIDLPDPSRGPDQASAGNAPPPPPDWGPPPGLVEEQSNSATSGSNSANAMLLQMLQSFGLSDPGSSTSASSVSIAA